MKYYICQGHMGVTRFLKSYFLYIQVKKPEDTMQSVWDNESANYIIVIVCLHWGQA